MKTFAAVRILIVILAIVGLGSGTVWAGTNVWTSHGPEGGLIRFVAVDPQNPDTVYARGDFSGLFKSTDAGESWRDLGIFAYVVAIDPQNPSILYAAVQNRGLVKSTDGGTSWTDINSGLQSRSSVSSLVIDPQNPNTVYAAFRFGMLGVFKTTDGGASWSAASSGLGGGNKPYNVEALAIDPQQPSTLYAGTFGNGIFKTTDGGASWSSVFTGFSQGPSFVSIVIDPHNPSKIYAATYGSIYKSTDRGESWVSLTLTNITALAVDPQSPNTLYCAAARTVFKTTDGGQSWSAVSEGLPGSYVLALAVARARQQDTSTIYAGTFGKGVFKSPDGGASWGAVNSRLIASWVTALAVDPQNPRTLYAGTVLDGVHKSIDGGASWSPSLGLGEIYFFFLTVDPHSPGTVYAGNGFEVFKSADGGTSWSELSLRYCSFFLAIDPQDSSTFYSGHSKSIDGGRTWTKMDLPQGAHCLTALAIDPQSPSTLYAGDLENRLLKSADGGRNWSILHSGLAPRGDYSIDTFSPGGIASLIIDPQHSTTLYATASTIRFYEYSCAGIFKSTDSGRNWIPLGLANSCLLAMDPQNSATLYASAAYGHGGIFKSADGGSSWSTVSVAGLTGSLFEFPSLVIDPQDSRRLYVGTSGSGVFEITFASPVLTLDTTKYCIGDSWNLKVSNAAPNSSIRLLGTSNGTSWQITEWRKTDANGSFSLAGTFPEGTEGSYTLSVEIGGVSSNIVSFTVSNCNP